MRAYDWRDDALCAQVSAEFFFPDKGGSTRAAKSICSRCPARQECLDFSLENDLDHGVFGGLSERERRPLKRETNNNFERKTA